MNFPNVKTVRLVSLALILVGYVALFITSFVFKSWAESHQLLLSLASFILGTLSLSIMLIANHFVEDKTRRRSVK